MKYDFCNGLVCLVNLDGPEENSSKLLSTPFVEDPQHRLKWTAYLEFTHNNEVGDLTWDKVCWKCSRTILYAPIKWRPGLTYKVGNR